MLIQDAAREFFVYMDAERGCSPATIEAYRTDIEAFARFLTERGEQANVETVTLKLVREWMAALSAKGLKAATRARRLSGLRSMFEYLVDAEVVPANPCRRVRTPKQETQPPIYLTLDECIRLLVATDENHYTLLAFRDHAALSLLLFTGLRRNELVNVRTQDLDLEAGTLRVRVGKGNKGRIVPVAKAALNSVSDWLELRPFAAHDYLLTTRTGAPLSVKDLHRLFHRTLRKAGIRREGITLHKLRHTFATLLLQQGVDIATLQRLLGHVSIESTAVYLHVGMDDLREAVALHPLQ